MESVHRLICGFWEFILEKGSLKKVFFQLFSCYDEGKTDKRNYAKHFDDQSRNKSKSSCWF